MPLSSTVLGGAQIAQRVDFYIAQYGTPCTIFALQKPKITAGSGLPGGVVYVAAAETVPIMFEFGAAANDAAALLGILDQQVAVGFVSARFADLFHDRDVVKDALGQFWTVRDLPNTQSLDAPVGTQITLVRTLTPPVGIS